MTTQNAAGKITLVMVAFLGLHGCSRDQPVPAKAGPATTVTVEIVGTVNDAEVAKICAKLQELLDAPRSSEIFKTSQVGTKLTVELSPVSDVKTFATKIDFGKVIETKDRTVKVEVK